MSLKNNSLPKVRSWLRCSARLAALIGLTLGALLALRPLAAQMPETPGIPAAENPVIQGIENSNPTTPRQLLRAVETLLNISEGEEAKKYLDRFLATAPSDAALIDLHREFGPAMMLRLSQAPELQPEGKQLADRMLDVSYQFVHDPERIAGLIDKLATATPVERHAAIADLRNVGQDAVTPLVNVLLDTNRSGEHAVVRLALIEIGQPAVEPLIGILEVRDNPRLLAQAIDALGRIGNGRATTYLIRPYLSPEEHPGVRQAAAAALLRLAGKTPDARDAELFLAASARDSFNGKQPLRGDSQNQVELWHWDATKRASVPQLLHEEDAALVVASSQARDLYQLWPNHRDYRRLYLATLLESAKMVGGLDQPLATGPGTAHAEAAAAGVEAIEDLLVHAMEIERLPAAIGAAEVLGSIATEEILATSGGESPLASALRHPDRRVRFAAASSIMQIDPTAPYPGSSHLPETLAWMARTIGSRKVLIGHSQSQQAQGLFGHLSGLGYEADIATGGRQLFKMATASPDYELILVSDTINRPEYNELQQQLRRDPRTAMLPLGLIARSQNLQRAQQIARQEPLTEAFPRPHEVEDMFLQIRRLVRTLGRRNVLLEERLTHGQAALAWLAQLAARPERYSFYNLLRTEAAVAEALFVPELSVPAAEALAGIATADAQRALITLASQNAQPLSQRQAAAAAFRAAVARRGIMLTSDEILLQYDRYNQSETLDAETQAVLASLLDTIERREPAAAVPVNTTQPAASP